METGMNWNETKAKLKHKFATLTDGDMLIIEGNKEKMIKRLQKKLGKTKDEIRKILNEL